jgi:hypothetical protein
VIGEAFHKLRIAIETLMGTPNIWIDNIVRGRQMGLGEQSIHFNVVNGNHGSIL